MPATLPLAPPRTTKPAKVEPEMPQLSEAVLTTRRARFSGVAQPQYLATTLDVQRIQNALRSAERGDTWLLFTYFRDMYASYSHLQSEWAKRKCVITGNAETLIPNDPNNKDDVIACEVISQIIGGCRNWFDGLNHLLDATLYPLAAAEKIFEPVGLAESKQYKHPLRMRLKEIAPIDPTLLCFKLPYLPNYGSTGTLKFNPDDWESWLAFYATSTNGTPQYSMQNTYRPNKAEHIVHRGNMMSPVIPPNFGGHMRAILFWWLLDTQDRDWWGLLMQKYGMPIPVAKVNTQQADTVAYMQQALALCTQLGGLVIDSKAEVDWASVAATDGAGAHKMFSDYCKGEVSKIVLGNTLSAKADKTGGMGSGFAQQSEEIREDFRVQDSMKLSDTLKNQLFKQCLEINGYSGNPPSIKWGGMREGAAAAFSKTLMQVKQSGLRPTDRGLRTINERLGVEFEVDPNPVGMDKSRFKDSDKSNDGNVKY